MPRLEGLINGHPFRAALRADAAAGLCLQVTTPMLRGAGAALGDTVELVVLGPEDEPRVPDDLRAALAASVEAGTQWHKLSTEGRRDWLRWVEGAKKAETRARRVTRTVEQLAEGKRRPCCVNLHEYALCRIAED